MLCCITTNEYQPIWLFENTNTCEPITKSMSKNVILILNTYYVPTVCYYL